MSFGKNLKELRLEKGITQQQLGIFLNVEKYVVSNLENDRSEPNIETIIKLANYFGVDTDFLLGKDNGFYELKQPTNNQYSLDELTLIKNYRLLSSVEKNAVQTLVNNLSNATLKKD